jgi:hypothetical protein
VEKADQPDWIGLNGGGNVEELDHVEPSLPGFVFGHEGLRPAEPFGDLGLRKLALLALLTQERLKMTLSGRVD